MLSAQKVRIKGSLTPGEAECSHLPTPTIEDLGTSAPMKFPPSVSPCKEMGNRMRQEKKLTSAGIAPTDLWI